MSDAAAESLNRPVPARERVGGSLVGLGFAALGVVSGDIGTSPLYTLKTVLNLAGDKPDPALVLGSLSLLVWTLIVITTIKYVSVAMRIEMTARAASSP